MLEALIRGRIAAAGPLTVAEYMALALTHPEHGYYMHRDPFGRAGDFTTAPEICQIFGDLVGLWCVEAWRRLGSPPACALVELGPGRGTLLRDILRASKMRLEFYESLSLHLVEASPALKIIQAETLAAARLPKLWHDRLDGLPAHPAIFVANEFFDALPVRQFVRTENGGEKERRVALDARGDLCFAPGGEVIREENPAAEDVMRSICRHIGRRGGMALIIDYGHAGGGQGDTIQAVRGHQPHPVLAAPGEADITAHVDFLRLGQVALEEGAAVFGPQPQGVFLRLLGGDILLEKLLAKAAARQREPLLTGYERLVREDGMGLLFKALALAPKGVADMAGF